jgi:hypothetical protein
MSKRRPERKSAGTEAQGGGPGHAMPLTPARRPSAAPGRTVAQDVDEIAGRFGVDAASLLWFVEAYRTCN